MASRRMIAIKVIDNAQFEDMRHSAKSFYFHVLLHADDDGFVTNVKRHLIMTSSKKVDLEQLKQNNFIIYFEKTDVLCVKHWFVHNKIRKEIHSETMCCEERKMLKLNNKGVYEILSENDVKIQKITENIQYLTENIKEDNTQKTCKKYAESSAEIVQKVCKNHVENGAQNVQQYSIGKESKVEESIGEGNVVEERVVKENVVEGNIVKEKVATSEEVATLFSLRQDVAPTHPLSFYEKLYEAYNASNFAKTVIKTLSMLHRHAEKLLNGEWVDYEKTYDAPQDDIIKQTYTPLQLSNVFVNIRDLDVDALDV